MGSYRSTIMVDAQVLWVFLLGIKSYRTGLFRTAN